MSALSTLKDLVEIQSESGSEDRIVEYIVERLKDLNPSILERDKVKNILINQDSDLWIVTHIDTIPVKRNFEFDGVYAYGTGCCDAKASVTAIILALEEVEPKFGVALLSDEEEGGRGSKIVAEEFKSRKAIVMEPTNLRIANRNYGSLEIDVEVFGESAHGACKGVNAIEKAIDLISSLRGYDVLIQRIEGGGFDYVVPDRCLFKLDFFIPPEVDFESFKVEVLRKLEGTKFSIVESSRGFLSGEIRFILERAIEKAGLNVEYTEMRSWTDAINLREFGWDVVVFGPGELCPCHTERERIKIEEILKAKDVLVALNEIIESNS